MIDVYVRLIALCDGCEDRAVSSPHYKNRKGDDAAEEITLAFESKLKDWGWSYDRDKGIVLCSACQKEYRRFNALDRRIMRRSRLSDERLAAAYKCTPNAIKRCREGKDAL